MAKSTKAKSPPPPKTAIEEYFGGILSGEIVACEKMKLVAAKVLHDFHHPGKWHYDPAAAAKHIDFIETFCHLPAGRKGVPFKLELFQRARLEVIFGFVDDAGLRRYQEVLIIEGRKNGKTTETSAVSIDMTANDDEFSPETYFVATKYDQAKKGFDNAWKMIRQSPPLKKHFKKRADGGIHFGPNMGVVKALASNTSTLDSLDISCGVVDELAAIRNRDLYDLIKQGGAARSQPLLFTITTNGFVRDNIFDAQYEYATKWLNDKLDEPNERFIAFIYELDDRDEWDKEECWIKANPGLGTIKSLDFLRTSVAKAKDDPAYRPTVMVKDFNMIENAATSWLSFTDIETREPVPRSKTKTRPALFDLDEMGFDYAIGGFDAADSVDLTAAVLLCKRRLHTGEIDPRIYVTPMFWLPEAVLETDSKSGNRMERDQVPYQLWESQGLLRTTPGHRVDKQVILDWFCEMRDDHGIYLNKIGYDRWHIGDAERAKFNAEFGERNLIVVRQGVQTLSAPMKELKGELKANLIVHNQNPVLMWNMANTQVRSDANAEIQPVKGIDPRKRIDGMIALLCAYAVYRDHRTDYENLI